MKIPSLLSLHLRIPHSMYNTFSCQSLIITASNAMPPNVDALPTIRIPPYMPERPVAWLRSPTIRRTRTSKSKTRQNCP